MATHPGTELPGGLLVRHALTRGERMRGLARRDWLPANEALWFPRCRSVHTFTMRFALDLIWLDGSGSVVRVDRDVGPRRLRTCVRARSVVECAAGTADAFIEAGVGPALVAGPANGGH